MTVAALFLVLLSALFHASWNLLAKKASGGQVFVWMFTTLSSVVLVPVAIALAFVELAQLSVVAGVFILGTALIHLVYFVLLCRGYQTGDLSVVYPLARGLGPTLAVVGAILVLGERPSTLGILGLALVVIGVLLLASRSSTGSPRRPWQAIFFGTATGICIALYTVWDKYAVTDLRLSPLLLEAASGAGISLMLTPNAVRRWDEVKATWRKCRLETIGIAVLAPLSYILFLTALSFTPLTYVAPAREISILFAAVMGTRLLEEGHSLQRLFAAASMVCGVVALAFG